MLNQNDTTQHYNQRTSSHIEEADSTNTRNKPDLDCSSRDSCALTIDEGETNVTKNLQYDHSDTSSEKPQDENDQTVQEMLVDTDTK